MDSYQTAMSQFPASQTNNAREIVRQAIANYRKSPSDRTADKLRDFGFEVDHDDYFDHRDEYDHEPNQE